MNFKTTAVLVILLVVVGAVWLFYPKSDPTETALDVSTPPADEQTTPILEPAVQAGDIVRVTVERPGKPKLAFARSPKADAPDQMENWKAEEPFAAPVLTWSVDGLVTTFTGLAARTRFEQPGTSGAPSAAEAGLMPPAAVVAVADKNGKEYKFEVGRQAPMSSDTYVRLAGQPAIYVAARDVLQQVKKDFNEYREKRLSTLNAVNATRVELTTGGKTYQLTRGADGQWVIDSPVKAYAEKTEVDNLVRKLVNLRAQEFAEDAPESLATYGLPEPFLTATVVSETKKTLPAEPSEAETQPAEPRVETVTDTWTIAVGGFADMKQEQRFAKLGDQAWVARVNQTDIDAVLPDLDKLRDARITRINANTATKIELSGPGGAATLEKQGGKWQGTGDLEKLELPAVTDLLEAFEDLRALDYVNDPAAAPDAGLAQPRARISVTAGGNVEPVTLLVGNVTKSARNAYVQREGQPTIFVVSAAQANRLMVSPLSLRARSIFDADEQAVKRLQVERGQARYALVREEGAWELREPADAPVDEAGVRALVSDLTHLRARQIAGQFGQGDFGLDSPALVVKFAIAAPVVGPPATAPAAAKEAAAEQPAEATEGLEGAEGLAGETSATAPAGSETAAGAKQPGAEPAQLAAPPLVEHTLRFGRKGTVAYGRLDDDPFVFELDETVWRVFNAELIDRKLFTFTPDDVVRFAIETPGSSLSFERKEEGWEFVPDPFVKLDATKFTEYLRDLTALRVESYVAYSGGDFAASGLAESPVALIVKLRDQDQTVDVKFDPSAGGDTRLAGLFGPKRVFRLAAGDVHTVLRGLEFFGPAEAAAATPAAPARPGVATPSGPGATPPRPMPPPRPQP